MQRVEQFQRIKIDWFINSDVSVRHIFEDNHNWDVFYYNEHDNCPNCDELRTVYFGCNSRLCSNCGKNYTDKWSKK